MSEKIPYDDLIAFLSDELDTEQKKKVMHWIDASEENRKAFWELEKIHQSVQVDEMPDFDEEMALQNVHADIDFVEKPVIPLSPWKIAWLCAAASVAVVIGFYIIISQKMQGTTWNEIASNEQVIDTLLPDSTKVWLNKATRLRFPAPFSDTARSVYLDGEAYFEVTPDVQRPFLIYANGAITRVIGTAFNIRARKSEQKVVVSVTEGKVSMADSASTTNLVLLDKGEKGILDKHTGKIIEEKSLDENQIAWKTGILTFRETPIPEVLETLSEHYQVPLLLGDSSLRNQKFTIAFEKVSLEEAKQMLTWGLHAEFDTVNEKFILKRK